ncbi:murein biosynthesis integral membrane protein MurJ [Flavobacterium undicola]|uniref:murein biosynthesis integral membrane protein MurJ n=1 Tax=Flavobacterium undicola TaxID=1932779 RepID=UPI001377C789|nr:murein biosynthesis integral membrane protein MurJ [Flavobacterium undicola]MBA0882496.1 murein biosynthesis integral membrane protein MurJ [Flavobacterium undicola]
MKKQLVSSFFKNDLLKSSFGLLVITLIVKVLGYIEKLVLANYYGTGYEVDVYTVVITIILGFFFFFREIIEPGFLRVFLEASQKEKVEKQAWGIFNLGIRIILGITITITIFVIFFSGSFLSIFAPGFGGNQYDLGKGLIRIGIPAAIFLALSTLTSIILNADKKFILPASGEIVFKGAIVLSMILLFGSYGIYGAIVGVVLGAIGRLVLHLSKLYKKISFKKVEVKPVYKKHIWVLTWPLLLGVGFSQISTFIDNGFASYLQEGAIAALSYSKKVVELPVVMFPYILSIVVFPYFSQLAIEKNRDKLQRLFANCLKWILIVFIPITIFFLVYGYFIIEIIFQRGAFDANSTQLTAKPFLIYSVGLVFFAIETILVIYYYANADTKTPVFVGMGCVILNIILTWVFVNNIGYIGIAWAFVIQKMVKNFILLYLLKNRIDYCIKDVVSFVIKLCGATILFGFLMYFGKMFVFESSNHSLLSKISFMLCNFIVSIALFIFFLVTTGTISLKRKEYFSQV